MSETYTSAPLGAVATGAIARRVSWGAIGAGCVATAALMILFTTLGIGIGAANFDPLYDADPTSGMGITSAIYVVVTQLIALGAGGYIAARLAGIPRTTASVLHGVSVWAVTTIVFAYVSIAGGGAMLGAASNAIGKTAGAVGSVTRAVVPDDLSLPNPSNIVDSLSIDALPQEVQTTLREKGITEANIRREAKAAFRNVFSQQEQQAAITEARQTLGDILRTPSDAGADIEAFFDKMVEGPNAILNEQDANQAMTVLENRLGITPAEAEGIVNNVRESVNSAIETAKNAVEEARQQAVETAQQTSEAIAAAALMLTLLSVMGLLAAGIGAYFGRADTLVGDRVSDHV
ncbi:hypothetical protein RDV64_21280 [Acuticoccus sp. MNP-M23]|uniref:hypothetical protein n=1 Tax=Acuticoccus sp. MNP-M23 TaxID=3072793 RepID=UPI0028158858|nr:hypothetical protein [Acuticoccus sp. MNP-M23]WMS42564.1 hypothetical protein RDV64_21280 [Acuticoccus sp. MNP-M23]